MSADRIYLDNNATTPILPEVVSVMVDAQQNAFANPGSQHSFGRDARNILESSRETIADVLTADPSEVIFTSGGTESLNAAVYGFTVGRSGIVATTAGEHPAMQAAVEKARQNGLSVTTIRVDSAGRLDANSVHSLPWADLKLICLILAHNETGVIQDIQELAQLCQKHRVPLLLDAVQAVGKIPVSFHDLNATALAFGAHKFHGPRGIGGLLLKRGVRLPPFLEGGHQENGRRAGTEPVPLIAGMSEALKRFDQQSEAACRRMATQRNRLQQALQQSFPTTIVHGEHAERLPNTLNVAIPDVDAEALLVNLDLVNVACSLGTTCASGSAEATPALVAMGCSPKIARSSVRFSLSRLTTDHEIDMAIERLTAVIRRMQS